MSGLTVHFSEPGIQGIQTHFQGDTGSPMVGSTGACRIHLALCKNEYLTSAWLCELPPDYESQFEGGNIMLAFTTSRRRTQIFTSEDTRIKALNLEDSNWTCLTSKAHTKVTGMMVDVFGPGERRAYTDFGVTEQKNFNGSIGMADGRPYYPELDSSGSLRPPGGMHRWVVLERQRISYGYYFMTSASLDNVARILVQHHNKADKLLLFGMQVIHHDGVIDTIGRFWDAEDNDKKVTKEVYNAEDGKLKEILFVAPDEWLYSDIVAKVADPMEVIDNVMFTACSMEGSEVEVISHAVHPGMVSCALPTPTPKAITDSATAFMLEIWGYCIG
jgi:hypothetical protein